MLHRYGSVAASLALKLLALRPGDRLDPVGQLAAYFGTGRGTVQAALKVLLDEGAVALESRGKLGSYVVGLDRDKLLGLAGISPLIGAMPVAYSPHFQGLAAGLTRAFERAGLPLVLAQLRGGRNRTHFLRTGRCDFAIVSRMAWEAEAPYGDLQLVHAFGPGSNVGNHVILLAGLTVDALADGMRVGMDPSSHDHVRLTRAECAGRSVTLVELSYAQVVPRLLAGEIDAAVWDAGAPLPQGAAVCMVPLSQRGPGAATDTEAVLVTRSDSPALGDLLAGQVDAELVTAVQRRVIAGQELPVF